MLPTETATVTPLPPTPTLEPTETLTPTSTEPPVLLPQVAMVEQVVIVQPVESTATGLGYGTFLSRMGRAMVNTAGWIWFMCGSIIFFSVAGLVAGLYFRYQERNRFQLIESSQEQDYVETRQESEDLLSQLPLIEGDVLPGTDPEPTEKRVGDDNWPASLP